MAKLKQLVKQLEDAPDEEPCSDIIERFLEQHPDVVEGGPAEPPELEESPPEGVSDISSWLFHRLIGIPGSEQGLWDAIGASKPGGALYKAYRPSRRPEPKLPVPSPAYSPPAPSPAYSTVSQAASVKSGGFARRFGLSRLPRRLSKRSRSPRRARPRSCQETLLRRIAEASEGSGDAYEVEVYKEDVELVMNQDLTPMPVLIEWEGNRTAPKRYSLVRGSLEDRVKDTFKSRKGDDSCFCQERREKCRVYNWKNCSGMLGSQVGVELCLFTRGQKSWKV